MKTKKTFISVFAIIALVAVLVVSCVACQQIKDGADKAKDKVNELVDKAKDKVNNLELAVENNPRLSLAMADGETNTETYIEKTIIATVYPEDVDASQKLVDWSVLWDNADESVDVSEYLTVTPTSDGATTAKIRVYKSFTGTIRVICTTRVGGYVARCACTYVGVPTKLNVTPFVSASTYGDIDLFNFNPNTTYDFDIDISNAFGDCADTYKNFTVSVSGVGKLNLQDYRITSTGSSWVTGTEKTVNLNDIKAKFIKASIVNGKLHVETFGRYEDYFESANGNSSVSTQFGKYKSNVPSYGGNIRPYFTIELTETNSGLTWRSNCYITTTVTTVGLNAAEIAF